MVMHNDDDLPYFCNFYDTGDVKCWFSGLLGDEVITERCDKSVEKISTEISFQN